MDETLCCETNLRRYKVELGGAMLGYVAVLSLALTWLNAHPESVWRIPVALAPLLPVGFAAWALFRLYRRSDELYRRIQIESLAFAFVGTALLVVTYGFLESAGFPKLTAWWYWVVMGTLWIAGSFIARWRYR